MESKFNYFIDRTEKDIAEIKHSQEVLHSKVDKLLEFKWQIIGGSAVLAVLASFMMHLILK